MPQHEELITMSVGREDTAQDPVIDVIIKSGRHQASLLTSLTTVDMTAIEVVGEVQFTQVNVEEILCTAIVLTIMLRKMRADHTIDITTNKVVTIEQVIIINNINSIAHQAIRAGQKVVLSLQLDFHIELVIKITDISNRYLKIISDLNHLQEKIINKHLLGKYFIITGIQHRAANLKKIQGIYKIVNV